MTGVAMSVNEEEAIMFIDSMDVLIKDEGCCQCEREDVMV